MNKKQLTIQEAYFSMLAYLNNLYCETNSEDLGALLVEMQIDMGDGKTMDPAAWGDWLGSVKKVNPQIEISEEMYVCCEFKYSNFSEEKTKEILKSVKTDSSNYYSADEDGVYYVNTLEDGTKAWKIVKAGKTIQVGIGQVPNFFRIARDREQVEKSQL